MKKHLDFRTFVSRLIVTVVMCLPAWGILRLKKLPD